MSKDFKPLAYYYARRNHHDLLIQLCDTQLAKKGKDPIILFWKAYGLGKAGYIKDCFKQLDVFHNRKDLQLPVTLAMLYFHKNAPSYDQETVDSLSAELSIAEDVTVSNSYTILNILAYLLLFLKFEQKDVGLVLAARFALITGDYEMSSRLSQKITGNLTSISSQHSTPTEIEAVCIDMWSNYYLATLLSSENMGMGMSLGSTGSTSSVRSIINKIETVCRNNIEACDLDMAMLWVACKQALNSLNDAVDILNQIIAVNSWFIPALSEKAAIQLQHCHNTAAAHGSDWEPVLDTAQRLLDEDKNSFDALFILLIHAFSQDGDMNDALLKLDDLDKVLVSHYPSSKICHLTVAIIVTQICCRNNRAIKICCDMLERILNHNSTIHKQDQAKILTELGRIKLLLGPAGCQAAIGFFREALKKDDSDSIFALLGMIQGQIVEGEIDDAEAQLELLTVMHEKEELGVEYLFVNALLAKKSNSNLEAVPDAEGDESTSRISSKTANAISKQKEQRHLQFLNECCQQLIPDLNWDDKDPYQLRPVHIVTSRSQLIDPLYVKYATINPDMLLMLALEYLSYQETYTPANIFLPNSHSITLTSATATGAINSNGDKSDSPVQSDSATEVLQPIQSGLSILKLVLANYPGFLCVYVETSRVLSGMNRHEDACRTLHQCMSIAPRSTIALIFKAKVEASRAQAASSDRCLEQALSYDFSVRSSTLYRLVRAQTWSLQSRYEEAIAELQQLVQLPEMRTLSQRAQKLTDAQNEASFQTHFSYADSFRISDEDKICAFVLLGYLYGRTKKLKDAKSIFNEAKGVFVGSGLEYVLLLASSQFAVDRKDFDVALKMLDKVHDFSPAYRKAQLAKADILLSHLRDQDGYLRCFQQLVEKDPSCNNFIALGEASLKILRPEAAVVAFEKAYEQDRKNIRLRGRIGRILVSTHEYFRAVDYYETAIREVSGVSSNYEDWGGGSTTVVTSDLVALSHDLAKLLIKLGRGEASARVLNNSLHESHSDLTDLQQDVTTFMLLSDVYKALGRDNEILEILMKAYELQKNALSKIRSASSAVATTETVDKEKKIMSNICERIGTIYLNSNILNRRVSVNMNSEKATLPEQFLNEAISFQPSNTKALISLAKLYMNTNDVDKCCITCKKALADDPLNEDASIMLSEAIFLNNASDAEKAIEPLESLLKLQPNNYNSLSRFISLLRRIGDLEKAKEYITKAEKHDVKSKGHPGYYFCQGLYSRYTNDVATVSRVNFPHVIDL